MFVFIVLPECTFNFALTLLSETHARVHTHTHTHTHKHTHTLLHPLHRFENQRKPISSNGKIIDEAGGRGGGKCDVNERVSSLIL